MKIFFNYYVNKLLVKSTNLQTLPISVGESQHLKKVVQKIEGLKNQRKQEMQVKMMIFLRTKGLL